MVDHADSDNSDKGVEMPEDMTGRHYEYVLVDNVTGERIWTNEDIKELAEEGRKFQESLKAFRNGTHKLNGVYESISEFLAARREWDF